jgi:hypothetical protein
VARIVDEPYPSRIRLNDRTVSRTARNRIQWGYNYRKQKGKAAYRQRFPHRLASMLEAAGGSPRTQKRGQDSPHGPRPVTTTTASLGRGPAAGAPRDPRCPWSSGTGLPDHRATA